MELVYWSVRSTKRMGGFEVQGEEGRSRYLSPLQVLLYSRT